MYKVPQGYLVGFKTIRRMLVKYVIEQEHDLIENSQFYLKSQWLLPCMIIQYFLWGGEQGIFFSKGFLLKTIYSKALCLRIINSVYISAFVNYKLPLS